MTTAEIFDYYSYFQNQFDGLVVSANATKYSSLQVNSGKLREQTINYHVRHYFTQSVLVRNIVRVVITLLVRTAVSFDLSINDNTSIQDKLLCWPYTVLEDELLRVVR